MAPPTSVKHVLFFTSHLCLDALTSMGIYYSTLVGKEVCLLSVVRQVLATHESQWHYRGVQGDQILLEIQPFGGSWGALLLKKRVKSDISLVCS